MKTIYDLSLIMRRAQEFKKKHGFTLSQALKASWAIEKKEIAIRNEWYKHNTGTVNFKVWNGGKIVRAYYTVSWFSNYQNNKGLYINL